jgi:hypothetical protein
MMMGMSPSQQGFLSSYTGQQTQQRRQNTPLFPDYPKHLQHRVTAFALRFTVFQHLLNLRVSRTF